MTGPGWQGRGRRPGRARPAPDAGMTLVDLVVSMVIMSVVLVMFTTGVLALFRSAGRTEAVAGAHAVIAPKDRSVGLNATAAKVASGAAETVPYITVTNLARTLGVNL